MATKMTQEEFIERASKIHKNKYDYSLTKYDGRDKDIDIICQKHGVFTQNAGDHLYNKSGCKQCANEKLRADRSTSLDAFISKARVVHGDKYDYSQVDYVNNKTRVTIICPKHGPFQITPDKHTNRGQGCPVCGDESLKSLVFGVGINDLRLSTSDPCYVVWNNILQRTVSENFKSKHKTYEDCTICEEWIRLSNFKKWFDQHYVEGYHVDKDILSGRGKKIYSPETCSFVPREINNLLIKSGAIRGKHPIGVFFQRGKFVARLSTPKYIIKLGRFKTPEEAFLAYKEAKEAYIKRIAKEYYDAGKIEKRVYDALMKYEVEITD